MHEQIQRIRELINKPIKKYALLKNLALWYQLCSCLDTIGDSELAIAAYSDGEFGASDGARYLAVYGLLQALFLQQDAVFNLRESLGMPNPQGKYPRLEEIREIRNVSIGHPTKRNRSRKKGQPTSYHFIVRVTLTPDGFELHSHYADGKMERKDVSVWQLIADQKTCLFDILTQVVIQLENKEKSHKEKFRMEKLALCFPPPLDYHLRKVQLSTIVKGDAGFGAASLQQVKQALQAFQESLAKRGIELDTYDSIKCAYEDIEYPLTELETFFQYVQGDKTPNINEKTAYIFAFFLRKTFDDLISIAQAIDEDFSN